MQDTPTKTKKQQGLNTEQLLCIMGDIHGQPNWRRMANRAWAYYDGDQLEPSVKSALVDRGQPATVHNLIAPTIDGVLGMEAKSRTDLIAVADDAKDDEAEQLADAINAEFADACRLGGMDRACADSYKSQIAVGIGWGEVRRSLDPFGPRYKMSAIHRDEIDFDWHTREPDLSDCRWIRRRRWLDLDEAQTMFPDQVDVLNYSINDWSEFNSATVTDSIDPGLVSAFDEWDSFNRNGIEWRSSDRKRILLQVVYYRTYETKDVLFLDSGRVIEYDKFNLLHVTAIHAGKAQLERRPCSVIREAWFAGPHPIVDRQCAAPYGMFPVVPFWGYRKDGTGEPYGLIARAMPAQDEVNFRRIKLTWLLQAKRVIMDKDATNMSRSEVLEQVERADGYIELNPDRQNKTSVADALQIQQDFNIAAQQFQVMQDSAKLIQDTMGVYSAFLGQESAARSGVAIANLVEQGSTTLAELNDNYRFARQQMGSLLLGYLMEDLAKRRNYAVTINKDDKTRRKTVALNIDDGSGKLTNDITRLRARISLAPIQQTPAYKQQLAERLGTVVGMMPDAAKPAALNMLFELLDIPNKAEFIENMRTALNIPKKPEDMNPQEQQAAQQQAQQAQAQQELAMREIMAKVAKLEAEAARWQAESQRLAALAESQRFGDAKTQAETGKILQEMERVAAENDRLKLEYAQMQQQIVQHIEAQLDSIQ